MIIHHHIEELRNLQPVACMGMFDGVHLGHRHLLRRLRDLSIERKKPSLLITFWPHPRKVLYANPEGLFYLNTLEEKLSLLAELEIDHVLVLPFTYEFSQQTACEFINTFLVRELSIDFLLVGFNHHFGKDRQGSVEDLSRCHASDSFGIEKQVAVTIQGKELSSSLIRESLHLGKVEHAAEYLGYSYFLEGQVVAGNQLGRRLGFPTANISLSDPHKLVPKTGVYAVEVIHKQQVYRGMLNVGYRPTLQQEQEQEQEKPKQQANGPSELQQQEQGSHPLAQRPYRSQSIEVHILDFQQDIYGDTLRIRFIRRLRDEQKFDSLDALRAQLEKDREGASR